MADRVTRGRRRRHLHYQRRRCRCDLRCRRCSPRRCRLCRRFRCRCCRWCCLCRPLLPAVPRRRRATTAVATAARRRIAAPNTHLRVVAPHTHANDHWGEGWGGRVSPPAPGSRRRAGDRGTRVVGAVAVTTTAHLDGQRTGGSGNFPAARASRRGLSISSPLTDFKCFACADAKLDFYFGLLLLLCGGVSGLRGRSRYGTDGHPSGDSDWLPTGQFR